MRSDFEPPAQSPGAQEYPLRILVVTRNLPPLIGGMERLLLNLTRGLADDCEVTVIGPRGCRKFLPANTTVKEASANILPFIANGTALAVNACRKQPFDLVIGGSGVVAPVLTVVSLLFNVPTLVLLHGLDIVFDHPLYRGVFLPCIRRVTGVIANSTNTQTLAIAAGLNADRITVINPGADLPEIPGTHQIAAFRRSFNIPFNRFILFAGRITPRKGLAAFIENCMPAILQDNPETGLVIVGDSPANSLNKQSELAQVNAAIAALNIEKQVQFLGHIGDNDLQDCFAAAALQVLPLIETPGDVEGFGMVAVEAAACGTPTVAFRLGGVADAVSNSSGALVSPGDYSAFSDAVSAILKNNSPSAAQCATHAERFAWPHYHRQVRAVVTELVGVANAAKH